MFELRMLDNLGYDIVGQDDTIVQCIARMGLHSGNHNWRIEILDHNTVRFISTVSYDIAWVEELTP